MNIAVLSDIHGNEIASQSCMKYLENQSIDAYCFLGDYIGEFPGIRGVMDTLYALQKKVPCYMIRGNKEEYMLSGMGDAHPEWDSYPSTVGMLRYGRQQLTQEDLSFIKALPVTARISIDGMKDLRICHGTPRAVREDMRPQNSQNKEILAEVEEEYMLCGHTHRVMALREYGKTIWNPGSVGLPIIEEGGIKTQFMILHSSNGAWHPEFVALDYDIERVIQDMYENGLYEIAPYWTRTTACILRGEHMTHGMMLGRAMALCEQETGRCDWPAVPEIFWKQAFEERPERKVLCMPKGGGVKNDGI